MFDIGWTELLVIACVAIIVVGPKDLPRMLRSLGQTIGKVKRMSREFQSTFNDALREAEREADIADMKKSVEDVGNFNPLGDLKKSIEDDMAAVTKPAAETKTAKEAKSEPAAEAKPQPAAPSSVTPELAEAVKSAEGDPAREDTKA